MKKLLLSLLCFLMLLFGCGEEKKEPVSYSENIFLVTYPDGVNDLKDLKDGKIAVQERYERDYADYVASELSKYGIKEENLVYCENYQAVPTLIQAKEVDAWIISESAHNTLSDFRTDYDPSAYKVLEQYNMPYYEEEVIPEEILNDDLYNKPFIVMCTGLDEAIRPNEYTQARNDVNILMVVNPQKKHVLTIGFPRDSYVKDNHEQRNTKLTHTGLSGTWNVKDSLARELDVPIDYFVQVSFSTFMTIIDSIGGIFLDVPLSFTMDQNSKREVWNPVSVEKGEQLLRNEQALAFARNRKYDGLYNGDYGRIRNQAYIVDAIIAKVAEKPYLMDWADWINYGHWISYNNFSDEQLAVLKELAKTFHDGYTIDNFFIENNGTSDSNGSFIGIMTQKSLDIAVGKIHLVMEEGIDPEDPYYEEIMTGYISKGAGTSAEKYIGEEYDLSEVFPQE